MHLFLVGEFQQDKEYLDHRGAKIKFPGAKSKEGTKEEVKRRKGARESGVVPANQTEESEVRELSEKESGTGSGTPFCL